MWLLVANFGEILLSEWSAAGELIESNMDEGNCGHYTCCFISHDV